MATQRIQQPTQQFESKTEFRWTISIPGVDAFLAKAIVFGTVRPAQPINFRVTFVSVASDNSSEHQLAKLLAPADKRYNPEPFDVVVKHFDKAGSVVDQWVFGDCVLDALQLPALDYSGSRALDVSADFTAVTMHPGLL